jgi:hypothetical protein
MFKSNMYINTYNSDDMKIEEWIKGILSEIETISKDSPKDRLAYISSIAKFNSAITASVIGWQEWLKNSGVMNEFSEDEITKMFKEFQAIATKFLLFDIEWTKNLATKFNVTDTEDLGIDGESDEDDEDCEGSGTYVAPKADKNERIYIS